MGLIRKVCELQPSCKVADKIFLWKKCFSYWSQKSATRSILLQKVTWFLFGSHWRMNGVWRTLIAFTVPFLQPFVADYV